MEHIENRWLWFYCELDMMESVTGLAVGGRCRYVPCDDIGSDELISAWVHGTRSFAHRTFCELLIKTVTQYLGGQET